MLEKSLTVFEKYVRSEETAKTYRYFMGRFLKWCKANVEPMITADGLMVLKEEALQTYVEDFLFSLRNRISPNSYQPIIAGLELYFSMNSKKLDWKKIRKLVPSLVRKTGREPYTNSDVKAMLKACGSKRNVAVIQFLNSTGARIGCIPELKIKNLTQIEDCMAVEIYSTSAESYFAYLTKEARLALQEYLDERTSRGEYLGESSPVFREAVGMDMYRIAKVRPMSIMAVKKLFERILKEVNRKKSDDNKVRYSKMAAHSLRKKFATVIKSNKDIPYSVAERLLGHRGVGQDESYFRIDREGLFQFFKLAIPEITIDDSERLKLKNEQLSRENKGLSDDKDKIIAELKADILNLYSLHMQATKKD